MAGLHKAILLTCLSQQGPRAEREAGTTVLCQSCQPRGAGQLPQGADGIRKTPGIVGECSLLVSYQPWERHRHRP